MLFFWDHRLIRFPEISKAVAGTIREWNGLPQAATRLFASISQSGSNDLTCFTAQCYPDPCLVRLFHHKGPQFIQFQYRRTLISVIRRDQRFAQSWKLGGFFLSRRSPSSVRPERPVPDHANYYALHRHAGSLLGVLLNRYGVLDSPDFASDRHDRDISAFHWGTDRYARVPDTSPYDA